MDDWTFGYAWRAGPEVGWLYQAAGRAVLGNSLRQPGQSALLLAALPVILRNMGVS